MRVEMICVQCGGPIEGKGKNATLCDECRRKHRIERDREVRDIWRTVKPVKRRQERPPMTLTEYNSSQRAKGMTYGGRPVVNTSPREPKFLEGLPRKWRRESE